MFCLGLGRAGEPRATTQLSVTRKPAEGQRHSPEVGASARAHRQGPAVGASASGLRWGRSLAGRGRRDDLTGQGALSRDHDEIAVAGSDRERSGVGAL